MACWSVVEIGLAFLFRGHAHGEPPAFQAAQRELDSLCPLHTNESPDTDSPVGAFCRTAYRSVCLVPVIDISGAPGTPGSVPTSFRDFPSRRPITTTV